jgi:hypothetical protein
MVLEEVKSEPDGFSDSPPSSDNDPYSSPESGPGIDYHINSETLPQPMALFRGRASYNAFFNAQLTRRIHNAATRLGRPPTQEEVDSLAYWTAKQLSLISYGPPIGYAGGLWRAYATRKTFRFPFYTPKFEHKGLAWPSSTIKILSGSMAVKAWHGTRAAAYFMLGRYLGLVLATYYSLNVVGFGERLDPRLKEYVQAVDREVKAVRGQFPSTRSISKEPPRNPTMPWPEQSREPQPNQAEDSPDSPQTEGQLWGFDTDYDGNSPADGKRTENIGTTEGSAWERLRQQGTSQAGKNHGSGWLSGRGQQSSPPRQSELSRNRSPSQQDPNSQGDSAAEESFAFPKSEEERQLAKEEAQKDFDSRVEQERKGGHFDSGKGYAKRW